MSNRPVPAQTRVTVKNVKHSEFASKETLCFHATVYIDGKKAGTVINSGQGVANSYDPWTIEKVIGEVASKLPPINLAEFGTSGTMPYSADTLIDDLVQAELERKRIVSMTSKKVHFRKIGETYKTGEWLVLKSKTTPEIIVRLFEKYGKETVILGHNHHKLD